MHWLKVVTNLSTGWRPTSHDWVSFPNKPSYLTS